VPIARHAQQQPVQAVGREACNQRLLHQRLLRRAQQVTQQPQVTPWARRAAAQLLRLLLQPRLRCLRALPPRVLLRCRLLRLLLRVCELRAQLRDGTGVLLLLRLQVHHALHQLLRAAQPREQVLQLRAHVRPHPGW
jgi:hypothetical protein